MALPSEATLLGRINKIVKGLGKSTPIEWQGLFGRLPKPFPIFIPLFVSNGRVVGISTVDVVLFFIILVAAAYYFQKKERDKALRDWEARTQAEARYYAERAELVRYVAEELHREANAHEQHIQNAIERFEAEDHEEAERHEAAKRAIGNGGHWR